LKQRTIFALSHATVWRILPAARSAFEIAGVPMGKGHPFIDVVAANRFAGSDRGTPRKA
jgi:hypothetical protein